MPRPTSAESVRPSDRGRPEPSSRGPSLLGWVAIASIVASFVLVTQTRAVGGDPAQMLAAGNGPLRPMISRELPGVSWDPYFTYDGHRYFAVATDLSGSRVPEVIEDPVYWYQRILYPALTSGFGVLSGRALLWAMIIWTVIAFVWGVGAVHLLGRDLGLSWLAPLAALANLGTILAVSLLTADPLAIALFFTGVWAWNRARHGTAATLLCLATLAKEVFLLPLVVMGFFSLMRRGWRTTIPYALAVIPAVVWRLILMFRFPTGSGTGGSLAWPGLGLAHGMSMWGQVGTRDAVFAVLALIILVAGILTMWHPRAFWRWLALPWIAIGMVGSHWVWDFGNNALRVISPLITIVILAALDLKQPRIRPTPASP